MWIAVIPRIADYAGIIAIHSLLHSGECFAVVLLIQSKRLLYHIVAGNAVGKKKVHGVYAGHHQTDQHSCLHGPESAET